jgi:Flp pilus assembly protein TadG
MTRDERGSAAVLVVVLLPLLLLVLSGVVQLGAMRVIASRVASAADLATLAATDDQDDAALIETGRFRLSADAEAVARQFFAHNLRSIAGHLGVAPEAAAAQADVAAFSVVPAVDPLTGWRYDRPTVRLAASVPVRIAAFGPSMFGATTVVNVRAASAPR